MTPSQKGYKSLAEIKSKLPKYCTVRKRKGYYAVYFQVPVHVRPEGWKSSYPIGNTRDHTLDEIIVRGNEFYEDLIKARLKDHLPPRVRKGSLSYLIARYKKSEHWLNLRPDTQKGYEYFIRKIHEWCEASGRPHIKLLTLPTITAYLNLWKDTPRTRKQMKSVLSKVFQIGIEEGFIKDNLVKKIVLPKSKRQRYTYKVWTPEAIDSFVSAADELKLPNVGTAVAIAWEAFRQTDVFDMQEPRDYKDGGFRFFTSKTDELVTIRASQRTRQRIDLKPRTQLLLSVNDHTQLQWTKDAFYHQFKKVRDKAGLRGYVFRHIRNSAAINALKADLNDAEFKQRFGWSRKQVEAMRDHYTDIEQDIIDSGADKLEAFEGKKL